MPLHPANCQSKIQQRYSTGMTSRFFPSNVHNDDPSTTTKATATAVTPTPTLLIVWGGLLAAAVNLAAAVDQPAGRNVPLLADEIRYEKRCTPVN